MFDPFAPGFTEDPYPQYAALRKHEPVHENPFGFWLVSSYDDVWEMLRSGHSVEERHVQSDGVFQQLREDIFGGVIPRMAGLSMLDRDPPDHTRLRRLVSKAFTPRAIQALRPRIAELTDQLLDEVDRDGRVDLIEKLAFPLPFAVIAEMLGTPPADHARLRKLTGIVVRSLEPVADPEVAKSVMDADRELSELAAEMIAWKRAHPADDLLSALIQAEDDGDVLNDGELVAQVLLLYIAGHETTVNLIGGGTLALLSNSDQLALLRENLGLVENAVEEMLRYDSPVQMSRRITLEPTKVRDIEIPAGQFLLVNLASANRDEEFFGPDAGEFRIEREKARHHLSFGAGHHHCLGASLARLEGGIVVERLVTRFPGLRMDGDVEWNGRMNLRGPARLPVAVR